MECEKVIGGPSGHEGVQVRVLALVSAAALQTPFGTCILNKDSAHCLSSGREEMAAIGKCKVRLSRQSQVSLVDECSGVERMAGLFPRHLSAGHPAQLRVNERPEFIHGVRVAGFDCEEYLGHIGHHFEHNVRMCRSQSTI